MNNKDSKNFANSISMIHLANIIHPLHWKRLVGLVKKKKKSSFASNRTKPFYGFVPKNDLLWALMQSCIIALQFIYASPVCFLWLRGKVKDSLRMHRYTEFICRSLDNAEFAGIGQPGIMSIKLLAYYWLFQHWCLMMLNRSWRVFLGACVSSDFFLFFLKASFLFSDSIFSLERFSIWF